MNDLNDLYQELILDHNRSPRNYRRLDAPDRQAEGFNPLCGDRITVFMKLSNDGRSVEDVTFEGSGCAISTASASLMTESLKGKTLDEAKELFRRFHRMLTGDPLAEENGTRLGKLEAFSGVCRYPARVKCATLCWHTVKQALDGRNEIVSTE